MLSCVAPWSRAQAGTLDQDSPQSHAAVHAAWLTLGSGLTWQQQVRVGIGGYLTGIEVTSGGTAQSLITIRIRAGAAWSAGPVLAERTIRKAVTGYETHLLDFAEEVERNTLLMPQGGVFEIEVSGQGQSLGLVGSYVNPSSGPPLYPQPLYFLGSRFNNGGWRIGFRTYVQPRPLCLSDFNSDGGIDGGDIASFISAWEGGSPDADVSEDGGVDGTDLYQFFVMWEDGSC